MTNQEILSHIDHTLLKATSSWAQIEQLCKEAVQYKCASVCIPPSYVAAVKTKLNPAPRVATVIGFPLGYNTREIKVAETAQAIKDGADEIDMVIKVGDCKNGDWSGILDEVTRVKAACAGHILKVIIECCYLTEAEKIKMCEIVTEAKADYIKTSTGFGTPEKGIAEGATLEDVELFKKHIGPNVKIKAAGGIRTREAMEAFLNAGCDRLGCSSAKILF
jgi:deoxyribose-phosphate aldolase